MTKRKKTPADDGRSTIDHLADLAPRSFQPQAQGAALAVDKAMTVLNKPVTGGVLRWVLTAFTVGVLVSLAFRAADPESPAS